jgi:hypothetical protein
MKKFIFKLLFFIIPILLVLVIVRYYIIYLKENTQRYKLSSSIENLIIGHSQPECALNDSLIENSKNMSQGGESYLFTYVKLKKILEINPTIKNVYLSFSNNQVSSLMDDWTFGDESLKAKYNSYHFAMDKKEKELLFKKNWQAILQSEFTIIRNNSVDLVKYKGKLNPKIYWGEYLYLKRDKTDSLLKSNYIENLKKNRKSKISDINIHYLKKIVDLCKLKKVHIFLFRTPIHNALKSTFDELKFQSIRKQYFSNIKYIDNIDFQISNEEFGDLEHLNYRGAKKYSIFFNTIVQKNSHIIRKTTNN